MAASIHYPLASQNSDVGDPTGMPATPGVGLLCRCSGVATRATSTFLTTISLKNVAGTTPPTESVTLSSPDNTIWVNQFITNYAWAADKGLRAFRELNPSADNNAMRMVATFMVPGPAGLVPSRDSDTKTYRGRQVASCPVSAPEPPSLHQPSGPPAGGPAPAPAAVGAPAPEPPSTAAAAPSYGAAFIARYPTRCDGDWLLYEGLDVSPIGNGIALFHNGVPLCASTIAISAARVAWWHGSSPEKFVHRPIGDFTLDGGLHMFSSTVGDALVVWQENGVVPRGVVVSESRRDPDYISLDRNELIHVIPNVNYAHLFTLRGSFDLWVKVVD